MAGESSHEKSPGLSPSAERIIANVTASAASSGVSVDLQALKLDLRDTVCYLIAKTRLAHQEFQVLDKFFSNSFVPSLRCQKQYQNVFGAFGRHILLEQSYSSLTACMSWKRNNMHGQIDAIGFGNENSFMEDVLRWKPKFYIWAADNNSLWLIPGDDDHVTVDNIPVRYARSKNGMVRLKNGSRISFRTYTTDDSAILSVLIPQEEENYLYHELERESCEKEAQKERHQLFHRRKHRSDKDDQIVEALKQEDQQKESLKNKDQGAISVLDLSWSGKMDTYEAQALTCRSTSSSIYRAKAVRRGAFIAVKVLAFRSGIREKMLNTAVTRLIDAQKEFAHPSIVRHFELVWTGLGVAVAMEYIGAGDNLGALVTNDGLLPEANAIFMTKQLLDALGFLQNLNIVHGRIRPSSILVDLREPFQTKLGGFPLLEPFSSDQIEYAQTKEPLYYAPQLSTPVGADLYPSHQGDVWSLGACLYYSLSGQSPQRPDLEFNVDLAINENDIFTDTNYHYPHSATQKCRDFLSCILQKDETRRIPLRTLQTHPWIANSRQISVRSVTSNPWTVRAASIATDSGHGTASISAMSKRASLSWVPENHNTPENDDASTVYTTSSLTDFEVNDYSTILAEDLIAKLEADWVNEQTLEQVASLLPGLLKVFAIKLGYEAPSQKHRDVMVFLHKYRKNIAKSFRQSLELQDDSKPVFAAEPVSTEVMDRWKNAPIQDGYEPFEDIIPQGSQAIFYTDDRNTITSARRGKMTKTGSLSKVEDEDEDDAGSPVDVDTTDEERHPEIKDIEEYRRLIRNDPGFEWLLSSLRREFLLVRQTPDLLGNLHKQIIQALPKQDRISRKTSPRTCTVAYHTSWDPLIFLESQSYGEPHHLALAKAITLTGNAIDAQALSCKEYMAQTWPSSGPQLLSLIQDALAGEKPEAKHTCKLPNGTRITVSFNRPNIKVNASGIPDFVAEIGEQLAWLGAALRIPYNTTASSFVSSHWEAYIHKSGPKNEDSLNCLFRYPLKESRPSPFTANGQCWHALFRYAVVVEGFPIRRRPESDTGGLEISLDMMAALVGSRAVEIFQSNVFIKGFSAMLVPTKKVDSMVVWHLLHSPSPETRIAYLDCPVRHEPVRRLELPKARHVVGWCSDAACHVGAKSANYKIRKSGLPRAHAGCVLEKAQIQGGQFITGSLGFNIGNREKPVHISRDGYMNKIQWMSTKYVLLWDEESKTGWLVNGARALLHVLRASLQYSKEKFRSSFLMGPDDLVDASLEAGSDAAITILLDRDIRKKPLYIEKDDVSYEEAIVEGADGPVVQRVEKRTTKYYCIQDRVEQIYSVMEKLVDHQVDVERQSGLQISIRPRRLLEGWDFRDLFTDGDPFFPRVSTLAAAGKGWVDFTRELNAVCLLGRGFGELIQPRFSPSAKLALTTLSLGAAADLPCSRWSRVPPDRYYLAVCIADMKDIILNEGDPGENPVRVCEKIIWDIKATAFVPCPCTDGTYKAGKRLREHCDPVQAFFPKTFANTFKTATKVDLVHTGAVLFGHSVSLNWFWNDHGDPEIASLPSQTLTLAAPKFVETGSSGQSLSPKGTSTASTGSHFNTNTPRTEDSLSSADTTIPSQSDGSSQQEGSSTSQGKTGKGKGKWKGKEK